MDPHHHKSPAKESTGPIRKVSAAKYQPALVRVRPLGSAVEGHLYLGSQKITPCRNCPPPPP